MSTAITHAFPNVSQKAKHQTQILAKKKKAHTTTKSQNFSQASTVPC